MLLFYRRLWYAVMEEMHLVISLLHPGDATYYITYTPEDWNSECNDIANYIEHRHKWLKVMTAIQARPPRDATDSTPCSTGDTVTHRLT